jgi:OOP family OmpA-OmpF porin
MFSFSFAQDEKQSLYKSVEDTTNSGISEGSMIPDDQRPAGFIIKHVKDDVDNDGVMDKKDECLDTPEGKVVDKDGCVKLIRLNVRFDFDKSEIKDEYKDEINEAVDFLKKNASFKVAVEGHTDSVGTHEYNYALSEQRADKIAQALMSKGIDESRIVTKGFGKTIPIASNETEVGRAQNRRVDISFNK